MAGVAPRIAIVDDDPSVRRALMRLLTVSSYEPTAFASAAEFISSLQSMTPECLVADFQMPEMTGFDLHIHLVKIGVSIPTIIITAHHDDNVRTLCRNASVSHCLQKPLDRHDLLSAIESAIKGHIGAAPRGPSGADED